MSTKQTVNIDRNVSNDLDKEVIAGQAPYTKWFLPFYDLLAYSINNRFFWRCPTDAMLDLYNRNVSNEHMDCGVGSGYLLDHCKFPTNNPRIALVDLNPNSLQFVKQRISRYPNVTMHQRNVLEPLRLNTKFRSIGVSYLLHCVPGPMEEKGDKAFGNLKECLADGGVLFGVTLLQDQADLYPPGRYMMRAYQRIGAFGNTKDTEEGLRTALGKHFSNYEVWTMGCAGLFRATV